MKKRTFLADFHVHTNFSDGKHALPEIIDFYGQHGFGAIAITDHLSEQGSLIGKATAYLGKTLTSATFPLYREILKSESERAWERYKMVVLPGIEFTKNSVSNHRSAHLLGIWPTLPDSLKEAWIAENPASQEVIELSENVHSEGGLLIAAHPVHTRKREKQTYYLWDRREEFRPYIDAWEVASGPYLFSEVFNSDLPKIASSDLHRKEQLTAWKTVLECERHPEAILEAIRKQELTFLFYSALSQSGNQELWKSSTPYNRSAS